LRFVIQSTEVRVDLPSQIECKRSDTMQTKSLCPECKKVIDATVYEENGQMLLKKNCPEHGTFTDVYWSDAALYKKFAGSTGFCGSQKMSKESSIRRGFEDTYSLEDWLHNFMISPADEALLSVTTENSRTRKFAQFQHDGAGVDNPITERDEGCPYDCGLCPEHKTTTVLSLIDVTNRCNQKCPVCFANAAAAGYVYEPSIEQIREMMQLLTREKPVRNWAIQFSGGEPTVRDDLPAIIRMARDLNFIQIQIATNGIRLANSVEYCRELMGAGLHTVYLQFNGMTPEPYHHIRGFNALPTKISADSTRFPQNCVRLRTVERQGSRA